MTKEELKKESEDIVYGMGYDTYESDGHSDFAVQDILIESLEPREKRIAELEYQLTHRNCLDCSNHSSNLRKRNLELEKENAELKEQLENDSYLPTIAYMQGAEKQKKKDAYQLTYAKELLAKWVELFKPKGGNIPPTPIQVDTEQFINSEVEK